MTESVHNLSTTVFLALLLALGGCSRFFNISVYNATGREIADSSVVPLNGNGWGVHGVLPPRVIKSSVSYTDRSSVYRVFWTIGQDSYHATYPLRQLVGPWFDGMVVCRINADRTVTVIVSHRSDDRPWDWEARAGRTFPADP